MEASLSAGGEAQQSGPWGQPKPVGRAKGGKPVKHEQVEKGEKGRSKSGYNRGDGHYIRTFPSGWKEKTAWLLCLVRDVTFDFAIRMNNFN